LDVELDLTYAEYDEVDDSFDYLLNLSIRSLTAEVSIKLEKEMNTLTEKLNKFSKITVAEVWLQELGELEKCLKEFN
jgi:hypothetical protein